MMFADLYAEETDRALRSRAQVGKPGPAPEPGALSGVASAIPSGLAAGGLEVLRAGVRVIDAWTDAMVYQGTGRYMGREITDEELQAEPETGKALGRAAKALEPDPQTTGTAGQILHGFAKYGGKAAGYALTFGPGGAVLFGADEAVNESERLREKGVDAATAAKAAAIHGLASAAGAALPLTGSTVARTVGLATAGGPVLYATEMAGIRSILEGADYQAIAAAYDPFDVTGLVVSTAAPLAFGAAAHLARARAAPKPTPKPVEDAARVALAAERDRVLSGGDPTDAKAQAEHRAGVKAAQDAINDPPPPRAPDPDPPARPGEDVAALAARETGARYAEAVAARQDAPAGAAETVAAKVEAAVLAEPVLRAAVIRSAEAAGVTVEPVAPATPEQVVTRLVASRNADAASDGVLAAEVVVETPEQAAPAARALAAAVKEDPSVRSVLEVINDRDPTRTTLTIRDGDGTSMAVRFVADPQRAQAAAAAKAEGRTPEPASAWPRQSPQERAQAPQASGQGRAPDRPATGPARGAPGKPAQSESAPTVEPTPSTPETLVEAARGGPDPAAGPAEVGGPVDAAVVEVVEADPDLIIEMDDGTQMSAAEALAAADEALAQAQKDSKAFEAAVSCFLRTGG